MKNVVFYHAGCSVCIEAEDVLVAAIDRTAYDVEIVHLGESPDRIEEAEAQGVHSVPAMVLDGQPLHINFGATLAALKK